VWVGTDEKASLRAALLRKFNTRLERARNSNESAMHVDHDCAGAARFPGGAGGCPAPRHLVEAAWARGRAGRGWGQLAVFHLPGEHPTRPGETVRPERAMPPRPEGYFPPRLDVEYDSTPGDGIRCVCLKGSDGVRVCC